MPKGLSSIIRSTILLKPERESLHMYKYAATQFFGPDIHYSASFDLDFINNIFWTGSACFQISSFLNISAPRRLQRNTLAHLTVITYLWFCQNALLLHSKSSLVN